MFDGAVIAQIWLPLLVLLDGSESLVDDGVGVSSVVYYTALGVISLC